MDDLRCINFLRFCFFFFWIFRDQEEKYICGKPFYIDINTHTLKTKSSSAYVKQLEECIVELQETNRRQEEERKKERDEREKENEKVSSIIEFLKGHGFPGVESLESGGSSSID